ncbi:MAG: ACP phosphodiesterase [Planctomycetota bacterium]
MNYLAHATLAEPSDDARLGSLLGDFRRGLELERFPEDVRYATHEHAALDVHFDALPEVRALRRSFPEHLRRYAGILIDVFVDHALVRGWNVLVAERGGPALGEVTSSLYRGLEQHAALLPPRLTRVAPHMAANDWLGSYGDLRNVERALGGIAARLKRDSPLVEGIEVLRARGPEFDALTADVLPRLMGWLAERRAQDGRTIGTPWH